MVVKGYVTTKTNQMASIGVIITSTYHTKYIDTWPNSSASCVMSYSWLSACQGVMQLFEDDPCTLGHLAILRIKAQKKQPRKLST